MGEGKVFSRSPNVIVGILIKQEDRLSAMDLCLTSR